MKIDFKHILNDKNPEMIDLLLMKIKHEMCIVFGLHTFKAKIIQSGFYASVLGLVSYTTGFMSFITEYLTPEPKLLKTVFVLCLADVVTGVWRAVKNNRFSPFVMMFGFATKIFTCFISIVIVESLLSPEELKSSSDIVMLMSVTGKLMIMLYPALSAFNNMHVITDGRMPPVWWMKKFKNFEKDGDIKKLVGKEQEGNQE